MLRPYAVRQSFIFIENFQKTKLLHNFDETVLILYFSYLRKRSQLFFVFVENLEMSLSSLGIITGLAALAKESKNGIVEVQTDDSFYLLIVSFSSF